MADFFKGIGDFFQSLGTGTVLDGSGSESFGKEFFTENPLGRTLSAFGIGDMYAQEQQQIDAENRQEQNQIEAEQRANAEYDRRMADERAYNDPSAQAERLRSAGINPMANLGQGVTSSSTKMSAPSQSSPSMSSPRGSNTGGGISSMFQLMTAGEQLKREKLQNDLLEEKVKTERVNQIATMSQTELNHFMLSYKKQEAPLLLKGLEEKNSNLVAERDKIRSEETVNYKRLEEIDSEITLNTANYFLVKAKEDGEIANTAYKRALTANERANNDVIKKRLEELNIKVATDKSIYEALYESGYFKDKTEADMRQAKTLADKMQSEYEQWKSIWGNKGGSEDSYSWLWTRFLYLLTNLFGGNKF